MAENNLAKRKGISLDQEKNTRDGNVQDIDCQHLSDLSEKDIVVQQKDGYTDQKKDSANIKFDFEKYVDVGSWPLNNDCINDMNWSKDPKKYKFSINKEI